MTTVLMLPPGVGSNPIKVNGRTYTAAVGGVVSVPDFDAAEMAANGWIASGSTTGTTAQRPVAPIVGQVHNDTTVSGAVVWNGKAWVHHQTGAVS